MNVAEPVLKTNEEIDGFAVTRVSPLPSIKSIAYELTHRPTGARIIHLHNDDAENLFSITFPTPPPDDTGVPHILEHSVLAGSEKYRVKDPFFEMVKCSMATFINAMTGSDYTVYPVASNVRQDFYNLSEVYWDAVFHPLLTENTFQREGHHFEFAKKGDLSSDLIIKGIVYNEMKGARSSPDAKVYDLLEKNLWPDTPYGKDSGGDPDSIPDLTWQGLRHFHQSLYHPSNAHIFLYGDIPTRDHLSFLKERLTRFQKRPIHADLPPQPRWREPRIKIDGYPVAPGDATTGKTYVVLNWLVGSGVDIAEILAFSALERILLGNQAAPLRKALIDSKLGEDLSHSGFWTNGIDTSFHIGLKGTEPTRAHEILQLVLQTLEKVADEGVSRERFDAAVQQLSYRYLEINANYPLHLMGSTMACWLHGADPLLLLQADQRIAELKRHYTENPAFFSTLIREKLLKNTHRLMLIVKPDTQIQAVKDAQFTQKMADLKQSLSREQLLGIARQQDELEKSLDAPNSPEALAQLPQLRVVDLPPKPRHIPTIVDKLPGGQTILKNEVFANGVNYMHVSFDLTGLPAELYAYLPLYGDCIHKMGAAGHDYIGMAKRIAAHTGGVGFSSAVNTRVDSPKSLVRQATFTTKFLDDNTEHALDVLRDFIFELDPKDEPRLKDVLLQARAAQRMRPTNDGLGLAVRHAGRGLNADAYLSEITGGVPQIHLFEKLIDQDPASLIERIDAIRKFLLNRGRMTISFTGTDSVYEAVKRRAAEWSSAMLVAPIAEVTLPFEKWTGAGPREGLAAPMNVAFCVMAMPAPHISNPEAPLLAVASRQLSMGYVLEEVRFKGTAYGGGCSYSAAGETFSFHSYRDPWINRTLDVYRGAAKFVQSADWSQADIDRSIIGSAKEGERPIRPVQATSTALWRYLMGDTPERREARHAAMLRTTVKDVKRVLTEQFEKNESRAAVCVVSSREKLEAANKESGGEKLEVEDILKG